MSEKDWLDDELAALAREDVRMEAPPRIRTAVLARWEEKVAVAGLPRLWKPAFAVFGVAAATLVAVLVLSPTDPPGPVPTGVVDAPSVVVSTEPETQVGPEPELPPVPLDPRRQVTRDDPAVPQEYVLVPDPFASLTPMSVMRVRMSRMDFAALGVPIGNPEAGGLVEVEMLVGDDGVARSIRRATFVTDMDAGVER